MGCCKKGLKYFVIALFFVQSTSFTDQFNTNAKIKALYIYNFAKYIEWPESYKSGDFVIGILGNSPVEQNLQTMAKLKKVFNQTIRVKKFSSPDQISKCHMLMLPNASTSLLSTCSKKLSSYSTLIITEKAGIGVKSGINFVVVDRKQKFELNKQELSSHKLTPSSNLLKLAILI